MELGAEPDAPRAPSGEAGIRSLAGFLEFHGVPDAAIEATGVLRAFAALVAATIETDAATEKEPQ